MLRLGVDDEFLAEELCAVGALAVGAYREDVKLEELSVAVVFASPHVDLGVEHSSRGVHHKLRVADEARVGVGYDRLGEVFQIGSLVELYGL